MERPPRNPREPIFTKPLLLRTILLSLLMLGTAFALFLWELKVDHAPIAQARTVVVNLLLAIEAFYLFNCRSLSGGPIRTRIFSNPWLFAGVAVMTVVQLVFTYSPFMNRVFGSAPIPLDAWLRIIATAFTVYCIIGFEKWIRYRQQRNKTETTVKASNNERRHRSPLWRRIVIFVVGGTLLIIGFLMLIFPGPAIVFIPLGLAILATEFRWAKRWLAAVRQWIRSRLKRSPQANATDDGTKNIC
jgi:uncharacterized protein (TIGR02611 family)